MKITHASIRSIATLLVVATCASTARGQCDEWSKGFEYGGFAGATPNTVSVNAMLVFDDGSGPALYAGGSFVRAGGVAANGVARWDGESWSPLGTGVDNIVHALASFDDGTGPALYAAGDFTMAGGNAAANIAKWDGASWSPLGLGLNHFVFALAVFDDGSGPALFAGGLFTMAGGATANYIAKWDGTTWSTLGVGTNFTVRALAVHDDGSGTKLYVGGGFTFAGGAMASRIARWNVGGSWSAVGSGFNTEVHALTVFDDGSGSALHAGGIFTSRVAKWTGSTWTSLAGLSTAVNALAVFDDGGGPALHAGGAETIAKWTGASWSTLGGGLASGIGKTDSVASLAVFDDGSGSRLFVGGAFEAAGGVHSEALAAWDGSAWHATSAPGEGLGGDTTLGTFPVHVGVTSMQVHDDGSGTSLFAGGGFSGSSGALAHYLAKFDGTRWSAVGDTLSSSVHALGVYDDGGGADLYVGGRFVSAPGKLLKRIARWDGSDWSDVGGGTSGEVLSFAVFDDGSGEALYVGGNFGVPAGSIARWDGVAWSALGSGINGWVRALAVHDDGSGAALFAAGNFSMADGVSASSIAKWDGTQWSALGTGIPGTVYALCSFDDGSGAALYAGGAFNVAGGVAANRIAKWDGSAWSALGAGTNATVFALRLHDDGSGSALCVGGAFTSAGVAVPGTSGVAKWDGANWSALGSGVTTGFVSGAERTVDALQVFDDGSGGGPELYVGGYFTEASGVYSSNVARFGACRPGTPYCYGDDLDPITTTDCPCGNFGSSGHGCANSNASLGGARLTAVGTTSPNTVVLTCSGIPNNNLVTFLRGTLDASGGEVFGDGVKCASGTVLRFGQQTAGQGGNESNTAVASPATVTSGNTRYYQVHYRNPSAGFCPPALFNASNAYRLTW